MSDQQVKKHDGVVQVRLKATDAGGRKAAIPPILYRCPVYFGEQREHANDCAFFFNEVKEEAKPGGPAVKVPIKFFIPELVTEKLKIGARFTLWEGRDIGEAEVIELFIT